MDAFKKARLGSHCYKAYHTCHVHCSHCQEACRKPVAAVQVEVGWEAGVLAGQEVEAWAEGSEAEARAVLVAA